MELVLRKYGNSTVLAFPPAVLRELGLKAGQAINLHATPDGTLTLTPGRRQAPHARAESASQPIVLTAWTRLPSGPVARMLRPAEYYERAGTTRP